MNLKQLSVLIVDGNPFGLRIARSLLKGLGIRDICEADNGLDAVKLANDVIPDIIFTGWDMEFMDGVEMTAHIRQSLPSPQKFIPIVMMTAHSTREHIFEARDAGVTEFIVKPYSAKVLYSRIWALVEKPRPFVKVGEFFGPDRRRKKHSEYRGPERRLEHPSKYTQPIQQPTALDQIQVNDYFTPEQPFFRN